RLQRGLRRRRHRSQPCPGRREHCSGRRHEQHRPDHGGMRMALFSRKKRRAAKAEDPAAKAADEATTDDTTEDIAENVTDVVDADQSEADAAEATSSAEADAEDLPRPDHLEDGPYDHAVAPEEDRIDLGGLQVPTIEGM